MDTQLIVTIGGIFAGLFGVYKYSAALSAKREKMLLESIQEMQDKQFEYYALKNGHLERISTLFSKAIDKNTRALNKMSLNNKK